MSNLEGYKFATEEEKQAAEKWFKKHGAKLEKLSAGSEINHHPIIYNGLPEEWQLRAIMPDLFDDSCPADAEAEEQRKTAMQALAWKMIFAADLSPMQAAVLNYRMFNKTHREIAALLGIAHPSVVEAEQQAIKKIRGDGR